MNEDLTVVSCYYRGKVRPGGGRGGGGLSCSVVPLYTLSPHHCTSSLQNEDPKHHLLANSLR